MSKTETPLLVECRALAQKTLVSHFPDWTPHDVAECEQFFYSQAEQHAENLRQASEDAQIVTRAVRYLVRHPVPKEYVPWFRERLAVLLDIACPSVASPICGEPFFHDLCRGMNRANELGIHRTDVREYQAVELIQEEIVLAEDSLQEAESLLKNP